MRAILEQTITVYMVGDKEFQYKKDAEDYIKLLNIRDFCNKHFNSGISDIIEDILYDNAEELKEIL